MISVTTLLVGLFLISAIYLYLHITRNFDYWKRRNVEYHKPTFFFGNFFEVTTFKTFVGEYFQELYMSTKKPLIGFFSFDQPFLLVRDPAIIKHIMIKDFDYFSDRSVYASKTTDKFSAGMLFAVKNPAWKLVRTKLTPALSSGKIKGMTPLIVNSCYAMVEYITKKLEYTNSLPAREITMKLTTDVIASCAFGIDANSFRDEDAQFRQMSRKAFENTYPRAIQSLAYFFMPLLVKVARLKRFDPLVTGFMKTVFDESLETRRTTKNYRDDLIDILLQLKDSNKENSEFLDDYIITAQALQFFIAGFETSGSTIFFTLYELAHNHDVQTTLRENINTALKKHGSLTYAVIQDIPYLDMLISETLRKYPVLPFLGRTCLKTYKIPNTDVVIDKGIPVYISLLGLHYDPQYFPSPNKYDPERFSSENRAKIPSCVHMPFGEGLRSCIGARFGLTNVKVAIILLLLNFEIDRNENTMYPLKFNKKAFLLAPSTDDINLKFKKIVCSY